MSLDNFHTQNPVPRNHAAWFPTTDHRHRSIQSALVNSNVTGDWGNRVPLGPIQPVDTSMRLSARPDPTITEKRDGISDHLYVHTVPYTHRRMGDTAEGVLLYQDNVCPMRRFWSNWKLPLKLRGNKAAHHHPY